MFRSEPFPAGTPGGARLGWKEGRDPPLRSAPTRPSAPLISTAVGYIVTSPQHQDDQGRPVAIIIIPVDCLKEAMDLIVLDAMRQCMIEIERKSTYQVYT